MLPTLRVRLHIVAWAQIHLRFELVPSGTFSSFACQVFDVSGGCTLGEIKQRLEHINCPFFYPLSEIFCVKSYSTVGMTDWTNFRKTKMYMWTPSSLPPSLIVSRIFFMTDAWLQGCTEAWTYFVHICSIVNLNLRKTSKTKASQLQSI